MAGFGGMKVVCADYRMPPDYPYPAAMDDAMAVYRELLKTYPPEKIGVFGTSTGGGMTLALVLRCKKEGLPLPGAASKLRPCTTGTSPGLSLQARPGPTSRAPATPTSPTTTWIISS